MLALYQVEAAKFATTRTTPISQSETSPSIRATRVASPTAPATALTEGLDMASCLLHNIRRTIVDRWLFAGVFTKKTFAQRKAKTVFNEAHKLEIDDGVGLIFRRE